MTQPSYFLLFPQLEGFEKKVKTFMFLQRFNIYYYREEISKKPKRIFEDNSKMGLKSNNWYARENLIVSAEDMD